MDACDEEDHTEEELKARDERNTVMAATKAGMK